jgi:dTDP-4-amino-4,6-dideoxygalactose transaminase
VKGVNSRLDAVQAAVLRVKLRHLTKWTEARRRHAGHYAQALGDSPVATPTEAQGAVHVYHRYVVRAPRREELMRHLDAVGITTGIHYPVPSHKQPALAEFAPAEPLAVTERLAKEVLSLPMYPEMADSDVDAICSAVAAFYAQPAAVQGA